MIDLTEWARGSEYAADELRKWLDYVGETGLSCSRLRRTVAPVPARNKGPQVSAAPQWIADAIRELPPLCTAKEAAEFLRVSERTLARYMASGLLKSVQRAAEGSARVLIPRAEIARYLSRLQ
jgi:excisionase family DNA binding protein